jgi:hypothetical protein
MRVIIMTDSLRGSIYPVLFRMVLVLVFVSVVSTVSLQNVTASSCSSLLRDADLDVAEAAIAGNVTMAMANQIAGGNMTDVQFLAIQSAQAGSISQVNTTAYTLELNNVSDSTIMFSDRPNRIVESVSTSDFVGNWTTGPNSFAVDEPNDALIVENKQSGQLETVVIESFSPVYDPNTNTVTYTIMTDDATSIELPVEFGQAVLVIDPMGRPGIATNT